MAANDVAVLVTDAMPYVTAAVAAYGGTVLAKTRDKAADATVGAGTRILQRVFGRKKADEPLPEPLAGVVNNPGDQGFVAVLKVAMRRTLERDATMLAEIRAMLPEGLGAVTQHVSAEGDAWVAGHNLIKEDHYHLAGRPPESQVELVDVAIGALGRAPGERDESPVLDVKVRNTGGQPAVLKRMILHVHRAVRCGNMTASMRLAAYRKMLFGAVLPVSATYDVSIPAPEKAIGTAVSACISQVVASGEADRFEVRLGMEPTFDGYAYQVSLELIYDGDGRSVVSAPVAVAFPGPGFVDDTCMTRVDYEVQKIQGISCGPEPLPSRHGFVYEVHEIREQIQGFLDDVAKVRAAIDREMISRGLPAPDWESAPPRRREELPGGLVALDGIADSLGFSDRDGCFEVTDAFWDPERSVALHVREFRRMYGELEKIVEGANEVDDVLRAEFPRAQATLASLSESYSEPPLPPEPPVEVKPKTRTPAELMQNLLSAKTDRDREEAAAELRTRMRSGDEATLWYIGQIIAEPNRLSGWMSYNGIATMPKAYHAAEFLDEFLRTQRPDDPEAFRIRLQIALMRGATVGNAGNATRAFAGATREGQSQDQALGATAALRRVLKDQIRALGPENHDTCNTRLWLHQRLCDTGDMAGAAAVLIDVVADQERTYGHDSEDAFAWRHQLGFCLSESGDKKGAVEVFSRLYPDAQEVLGPDHIATLGARHELARARGESDDPATAAAALAELVPDMIRIEGPDNPNTLTARHNLARFQGMAGDPAAAVAELEKVVADKERVLGARHSETKKSREALAHWRKQASGGSTQ